MWLSLEKGQGVDCEQEGMTKKMAVVKAFTSGRERLRVQKYKFEEYSDLCKLGKKLVIQSTDSGLGNWQRPNLRNVGYQFLPKQGESLFL